MSSDSIPYVRLMGLYSTQREEAEQLRQRLQAVAGSFAEAVRIALGLRDSFTAVGVRRKWVEARPFQYSQGPSDVSVDRLDSWSDDLESLEFAVCLALAERADVPPDQYFWVAYSASESDLGILLVDMASGDEYPGVGPSYDYSGAASQFVASAEIAICLGRDRFHNSISHAAAGFVPL